jgi:hypothetical protein
MFVDVGSTVGVDGGVSVASRVTVGLVVGGTSYRGVGICRAGVSVGMVVGKGVACGAQDVRKRQVNASKRGQRFIVGN